MCMLVCVVCMFSHGRMLYVNVDVRDVHVCRQGICKYSTCTDVYI